MTTCKPRNKSYIYYMEFEKPLTKTDLANLLYEQFGVDLRYAEAFTIECNFKKYESGVYIKSKGLAMNFPIEEYELDDIDDEDDEEFEIE